MIDSVRISHDDRIDGGGIIKVADFGLAEDILVQLRTSQGARSSCPSSGCLQRVCRRDCSHKRVMW